MNDIDRRDRCANVDVHYYPDRTGFMCRVYGRWVRDCFDCAFKFKTDEDVEY